MIRWIGQAIAVFLKPKGRLVAENLCLRQQLLVLQRRHPRPRLENADRRVWILAWHRKGWRAYWRWRSRRRGRVGRRGIPSALRALIRRMAAENGLWGQRRIQAELARLGFKVSARTVAKYMRGSHHRGPSPGWRTFLTAHAREIWACDFFCVRTIFFRTIYVFFVVHHPSREVLHGRVTRHPTSEWVGQQIVETCGWEHEPPHFLIHDRDSRFGASFDRRVNCLDITSIRARFRSPQANAIAERWIRSVRTECLDHMLILNERHLRRVLAEYVAYFNLWRPHRTIGQRAPCALAALKPRRERAKVVAEPVLGGLHHVYQRAA